MPSRFLSLSVTEAFDLLRASLVRHGRLVRFALYGYVLLIACPIRYWPLERGVDPTWRFALNYASAQGSAVASETVFTMGPLSYLTFPQHIGSNLAHGLLFQAGLWLILATIFADLFFRAGFRLRNLALFSFCLALATPLFWFDFVGTENLMLTGALLLIVLFHFRGSWVRYLGALVLVGLLPVLKLSGALLGLSALIGFLVERVIHRRWKALLDATVTVTVLAAVATAVCFCVLPSVQLVRNWLRGSAEIIGGYSAAMPMLEPGIKLVSILTALAALVVLLGLQAASTPRVARFYVLLLGIPLFLSFKHGFVREDIHVLNFYCFVALVLGLVLLTINLDTARARRMVALAILAFLVVWQPNVSLGAAGTVVAAASGEQDARMVWGALRFDTLKRRLDSHMQAFPEDSRIEPEIVRLIADSPVASLSNDFTNMADAHLRLKLYPVLQRYSAYTPYLDGLNAAWIRDQGPRFLVFDGQAIDTRDPWAETPAMWLEVYRWYDARLLGSRNLLLERRARPRFTALESIGRFRMGLTGELRLPVSSDAVFWTMKCDYNTTGQLQSLLFRVPPAFMSIHEPGGFTRSARVIPQVLVSPVMGNYLPSSLSQFYAVFRPGAERGYSVDRIRFNLTSGGAFSRTCNVEILRPVR